MKERALVVHTGGIGDFICALPAIAWLRTRGRVEIAGIPERAALAAAAGVSDGTHDLDGIDFHTVFTAPSPRLRSFCAPFDAAYVWMNDDDGQIASGLRAAGIGRVQCFPGLPPASWDRSAALWYGACLEAPVSLPATFSFAPSEAGYDVILHPGSGNPKKNWPGAYFAELAHGLEATGLAVSWCVGPAEVDQETLGKRVPSHSLVALAGVLSRTRLFIGNDSGIGHLACVAGCPTVSIFGPTDSRVWRPIGPRSTVVQGSPWPGVEAVVEAAHVALRACP